MRTSFIFNTAKIILERVKEVEEYEIKYKLELPPIYKSFLKHSIIKHSIQQSK